MARLSGVSFCLDNHWAIIDIDSYDSKTETGFVPLVNQGATDYLSALLVLLFSLIEFRRVSKGAFRVVEPDHDCSWSLQFRLPD